MCRRGRVDRSVRCVAAQATRCGLGAGEHRLGPADRLFDRPGVVLGCGEQLMVRGVHGSVQRLAGDGVQPPASGEVVSAASKQGQVARGQPSCVGGGGLAVELRGDEHEVDGIAAVVQRGDGGPGSSQGGVGEVLGAQDRGGHVAQVRGDQASADDPVFGVDELVGGGAARPPGTSGRRRGSGRRRCWRCGRAGGGCPGGRRWRRRAAPPVAGDGPDPDRHPAV